MDLSPFLTPTRGPEIISIPLEKYSHSSSAPTSPNHQWTHESKRDGLFLVFQNIPVVSLEELEQHFMMSISLGGNILERQDIGQLVDMTKRFETMSQTMALNTSHIDAPVQIVVKRPCIAMRYTKDPTRIQRIQVRFKHDSDYETSLDIFKNLGLPIKDATPAATTAPAIPSGLNAQKQSDVSNQNQVTRPTTLQIKDSSLGLGNFRSSSTFDFQNEDRPRSTSSGTLRPDSAAPLTPMQMDRPSRPFSSLSYSSTLIPSIPTPSSKLAEGSLRSNKESSIYVDQLLNHSREGKPLELHGEISSEHRFSPHIFQGPPKSLLHASNSPGSTKHNAPLTSTFSYPSNNQGQSTSASSIYVSQMQGMTRSEIANLSSHLPVIDRSHATNSNQEVVSDSPPNSLKFNRSVSSLHPGTSFEFSHGSMVRKNSLPVQSSQEPSLPRPQSVPNAYQKPSDHDWIPPKRDLPFLKDRQNSKVRVSTEVTLSKSNATTTTNDSPPRTSSTPVTSNRVVKRVAQRNTKKMPVVQAEVNSDSARALEQDNMLSVAHNEGSTFAKNTTDSSDQHLLPNTVPSKRPSSATENTQAGAKRPKLVDHSSQTQALPSHDSSALPVTLSSNAVVSQVALSPPSPPPPNIFDQIDEFVTQNKSRPAPIDPHERPGYSEASEEERRAIVDDWIFQNLENEDFRKLCEDVGNAWRRIGLGF